MVQTRNVVLREDEVGVPIRDRRLAEYRVLEMGLSRKADSCLRGFGLMKPAPWRESLPMSRHDIDLHCHEHGTVESNTDLWFECRRGRITASTRAFALQGGDIQEWKLLAQDLRNDMAEDYERKEIPSQATAWGHKYEPKALREVGLMLAGRNCVFEPGFVLHELFDVCGATPDGYLDGDTTIQVKCLNRKEHELTISSNTIQNKYYSQVQFESWVSKRPRIIYASFHPLVGKKAGDPGRLHLIEVPMDCAMHERFACNLERFRLYFEGHEPWPVPGRQISTDGGIHVGSLFP